MRCRIKRDSTSQTLQIFRCLQRVTDGYRIRAARLFNRARHQLKRITGHVAVRCNVDARIVTPAGNEFLQYIVNSRSFRHACNIEDDVIYVISRDFNEATGHGTFSSQQLLRDSKFTRLIGNQADLLVVASCDVQTVKITGFLNFRQDSTVINVTCVICLLGDDRTTGRFYRIRILTADTQRKIAADFIDDGHLLKTELFNGVLSENRTTLWIVQAGTERIRANLAIIRHGHLRVGCHS